MARTTATLVASRRRPLALLLLAPMVLGMASSVLLRPSAVARSDEPQLWSGSGHAFGVEVSFNTTPRLVPLEDLIHVDAPDAMTTWDQASGTARASLLYPGSSGTGGPGLLCQAGFPCPEGFPPRYPLVASAQQSTRPDDRTPDGSASAHVGEEVAMAKARLSEAAPVHGALSAAVTLGGASASSRQWFEGGVLNVEASSAVTDVRILDGLVEIDQVRSLARSRTDGSSVHDSTAEVVVEGVRVAGRSAEIGEEGIEVAGSAVPGFHPAGGTALDELLAERGVSVRRLQARTDDRSATTTARATGLLVTAPIRLDGATVPGLPGTTYRTYVTSIVIGGASTSAFADPEGFGAFDAAVSAPVTARPRDPVGGSSPAAPQAEPDLRAAERAAAPVPGPAPAPAPAPPAAASSGPELLESLAAADVEALYLAAAGAALALFVAARLAARSMHLRPPTQRRP